MITASLSSCAGASQDDARYVPDEQTDPIPPSPRRDTRPVPESIRAFCSYEDRTQLAGPVVQGTPVEFKRPRGSRMAPPDAVRCVVRSWAQWERLRAWGNMGGFASVTPELFTHSMLILASMGEAPNSGYTVWTESVHSADGVLLVSIRSEVSGDIVMQAISYPADLIQVESSDAEVRFLER